MISSAYLFTSSNRRTRNGISAQAFGVDACLERIIKMAVIPDSFLDLLQQKKAFAGLATIMADGSPQVTPVWFDYADSVIRVNTAKGRVKSRTLRPGAAVAFAIMDPDNPYRYVQI